jgi:putative DNA primase/helicase
MPSLKLKTEAMGAGYSWTAVEKMAQQLGVQKEKRGMNGGWFWALPRRTSR